ncbi:hypothetical protein BDQ17DRAFT_1336975 [Cyathus striatus]|nr:hypothetical protein BDQ17DRAFT_1336975 [Cyathus striatus]
MNGSLIECRGVVLYRLTIEELLNQVVEQELVLRHTSDEDIYQAIMDMCNREEMLELNPHDGKHLKQQLFLLEKELAVFGRQTHIEQSHSMVPTKITQFFSRM